MCRTKVGKAANIYGAPLAVIVCADHERNWTRPFDGKQSGDIDASILTDHMMLEATELGLGSVWIAPAPVASERRSSAVHGSPAAASRGDAQNADPAAPIADTLNGLMAIPNLIGLILLCPVVFKLTREYFDNE